MDSQEKVKTVLETIKKKINRQAALSFASCVHCGMCNDSCHYYEATQDPKMTPAYKADRVRKIYKHFHDWLSQVSPRWTGAATLKTEEDLDELMDVVFGSCTMCRRCTVNCPMGIDKALLMRIARGALCAVGKMPEGVIQVNKDQYEIGNQMAVSKEDYVETIEWLCEEHAADVDDPKAILPLDKKGANVAFTINPREVKFAPLTLLAAAKVFYAAGEDWTMMSEGWDNTNFGLFSGDDQLGGLMGKRMFEMAQKLGVKKIIASECGHGFRATRWESPNWAKMDPGMPIESFLETMVRYHKQGRIKLNPSVNKQRVTYHDPCNLARSSGITEEPRYLLRQSVCDFQEMHPNRADNWCCSGGGGAMSMSEYTKRRLEVAKVKADQLRATGAKIVATACHNCVDGLSDLIRHYKLDMEVKVVGELLADALILEPKAAAAVAAPPAPAFQPGEKGKTILVIDDEAPVRTYLSTLFEDNGYKVVTATDANQGMRVLREEKPDLVTLDLVMPKHTGFKFYWEVRRNGEFDDLPVFVVTGIAKSNFPQSDFKTFLVDRKLSAPEAFIEKPVDRDDLLAKVKDALGV